MDPDDVRGLLNQVLYSIDSAADLGESSAARLADAIIDGKFFASGAADLVAAIDAALRVGGLHPQNVEMSRRFTEPELLDFLARVARRLHDRRPGS